MSFRTSALRLARSTKFIAVVLCIACAYTAFAIYSANRKSRSRIEPTKPTASAQAAKPAPLASERPVLSQIGTGIVNIVLPETPEPTTKEAPVIPKKIRDQMLTPPVSMSLFPIKPTAPAAPSPTAPDYYLPTFRMIRCKLANAVETGSGESPLIGYVLEDQVNIDAHGISRVVIPAGVEVHGTAGPAMRERITSAGSWTFVWRTTDTTNARELRVNAVALNRDRNEETGIYGISDGGPGIAGTRIDAVNDKEIRSLALAFVSATTRALKSTVENLNPLTNQVVSTAKNSYSNAVLEGAASTLDEAQKQAEKIRARLEQDGFYVAVLPGSEFYLYTKEPIDLRRATGPGTTIPAGSLPMAESSALPSRALNTTATRSNPPQS
jgi:hypothetical protein